MKLLLALLLPVTLAAWSTPIPQSIGTDEAALLSGIGTDEAVLADELPGALLEAEVPGKKN